MALGYEGYIKIGGNWCLGTGSAIPNTAVLINSSGAYGGKITSATEMGIGAPHAYDWSSWDGSLDFELTSELVVDLKGWILDTRDTTKNILVSTRYNNLQEWSGYWSNINFAASEGSMATGSCSFVAMDRTSYTYGSNTQKENSETGIFDLVSIPYWETQIDGYVFLEWSLDFTQDVVRFFACNMQVDPVVPAYVGVGPVAISLSGTYILADDEMSTFPGTMTVKIGTTDIDLKSVELQSQSDDVVTGNGLVPIAVTMDAYEVA